jgi:hypothetical protein
MDKVDLPILPPTLSLKAALDIIRLMGRSALVMRTLAGDHAILDRKILLSKGQSGNTAIGEIAGVEIALHLPEERREFSAAMERLLDGAGTLLGIGAIGEGVATIYTRHEGVAANIQLAIGYCQCTGDEREICAPGDYSDGLCARGHPLVCTGA